MDKSSASSICIVCGRNDQLRDEFQTKDWNAFHTAEMKNGQQLSKRARIVKFIKAKGRKANQNLISHSSDVTSREGNVNVVGLGFVSNMAEYMVASDILVSKAGPGTIAEAASVGLPIMLTR
jgi:1,2-diacylglycerol 3-beta-galactosyltransferase